MTIEEILAGESKNVEFKVQRPDKSIKYMKTVVAFANGKGGQIIFGIDDKNLSNECLCVFNWTRWTAFYDTVCRV